MWLQTAPAAWEGLLSRQFLESVLLYGGAVVGIVLILQIANWITGGLVNVAVKGLIAVVNSAGFLSLLVLLTSWLIAFQWSPAEIRADANTFSQYAYHQELFRQLTAGWDWERLRLGATIWVVVELMGLWTTQGNPIPFVTGGVTAIAIGLVLLQYTALGGGQPVWAMEHLIKHIMEAAGFDSTDFDALRHFAHERLAGRTQASIAPHSISLRSQAALVAIAILLSGSIRSLVRLTLLPGHTEEQQARRSA